MRNIYVTICIIKHTRYTTLSFVYNIHQNMYLLDIYIYIYTLRSIFYTEINKSHTLTQLQLLYFEKKKLIYTSFIHIRIRDE